MMPEQHPSRRRMVIVAVGAGVRRGRPSVVQHQHARRDERAVVAVCEHEDPENRENHIQRSHAGILAEDKDGRGRPPGLNGRLAGRAMHPIRNRSAEGRALSAVIVGSPPVRSQTDHASHHRCSRVPRSPCWRCRSSGGSAEIQGLHGLRAGVRHGDRPATAAVSRISSRTTSRSSTTGSFRTSTSSRTSRLPLRRS